MFHIFENDNFSMNIFDIFLIFALNIDFGYTLEPPHCGGSNECSNEYPQSMFESKNKKTTYTPVNPILLYTRKDMTQSVDSSLCLENRAISNA